MSKLNINKDRIINKLREYKRHVGIAAGVLLAVGISTTAVAHFSMNEDVAITEDNIIEDVTETTTTDIPMATVVTSTAKSMRNNVTTALLTTLNTTAGTVIETPTITTVTTIASTESIKPLPAPPKMEQAEEPTTAANTTVVESTTTETTTESTTEATTTTVATTVEETTTTTTSEPEVGNREFTVYKPSTHYVHRNTCHWCTDECYEITSTEGLEARYCTECNPDIEIVTAYQVPTPTLTSLQYVTEEERIYLCNTVAYEYGSDWVPLYDKACVVATVMNRVRDGGWTNGLPSTVYNVLTAPYQYNPVYATPYYSYNVTQSCIDAVEYYFEHQSDFPHYTSFWGDGRYNYFR